jgi:hypothetical protein
MLGVAILSAIMFGGVILRVEMLNVECHVLYTACHNARCRYSESHCAQCGVPLY